MVLNSQNVPIILKDREIRDALLLRLKGMPVAPKALLEEVHVHNGNAIADVVAVHTSAHCYEIKGETDSISRLTRQSLAYDKVFNKVTLVTTPKKLNSALKVSPKHWGIIVACNRKGEVKLSYMRGAKPSPNYDKSLALLTLWRQELISLAANITSSNITKLNRKQLVDIISNEMQTTILQGQIGSQLIKRVSG